MYHPHEYEQLPHEGRNHPVLGFLATMLVVIPVSIAILLLVNR